MGDISCQLKKRSKLITQMVRFFLFVNLINRVKSIWQILNKKLGIYCDIRGRVLVVVVWCCTKEVKNGSSSFTYSGFWPLVK